ncbi:hypothetical protein COBT_000612, partial [Conglomerata obtusa]
MWNLRIYDMATAADATQASVGMDKEVLDIKNKIVLSESCLVEMKTLVFRMKNIKGLDEVNLMDILGDASMALVKCIMEVNKNSLDTVNDTLIKMGEKVKEEKLLNEIQNLKEMILIGNRNGLRKPLGFAGNMRYQASGKYGN